MIGSSRGLRAAVVVGAAVIGVAVLSPARSVTTWAGTPTAQTDPMPRQLPDRPFGLVTDLAYASPSEPIMRLFHESGAQWARERLRWDRAGQIGGPYTWTQPQPVLRDLSSRGVRVLGLLSDPPPAWVDGRPAGYVPAPIGPDAAGDWGAFVESAGRATSRHVDAWEIWDRPNDSATWKPRPHADDYAVLLQTAHDTLKTRDPGASIVMGATSGVDRYFADGITTRVGGLHWIETLLDLGAGAFIDTIAVHAEGDTPEHIAAQVSELALELDKRPEAKGIEIWVTDVGWSLDDLEQVMSSSGWTADEAQAAYLTRTYAALLVTPRVERVFWRGLLDRDAGAGYALLSLDGTPRPSYLAYQTVVSMLDGATYVGQQRGPSLYDPSDVSPEPTELRFLRRGDTVIVAWFRDDNSMPRSITLTDVPSGPAELVANDGTRTPLEPIDGKVTVEASEEPVFVVVHPAPIEEKLTWPERARSTNVTVDADTLRDGVRRLGELLRRRAEEIVAARPSGSGAASPTAASRMLLDALASEDAGRSGMLLTPGARRPGQVTLSGVFAILAASELEVDPSTLTTSLLRATPTSAQVRVHGPMRVRHDRDDEVVSGSLPVDVVLHLQNRNGGWVVSGVR